MWSYISPYLIHCREEILVIEYDIKNALKGKDCIICVAVEESMSKVIWWFKTENYHEHSTLESLREFPYICEKHKKQLTEMGDKLSTTLEFLVKADSRLFRNLLKLNNRRFKKELHHIPYNSCKFCENEKNIEKHAIETFANMLKDRNIREMYSASGGLCRKHTIQLIRHIGEKDERIEFILKETLKRLDTLQLLFENFFHKLDYRFSGEEKGKEQTTWLKALGFYSQSKD